MKVFVFGAGASASEPYRLPTTARFFSKAFDQVEFGIAPMKLRMPVIDSVASLLERRYETYDLPRSGGLSPFAGSIPYVSRPAHWEPALDKINLEILLREVGKGSPERENLEEFMYSFLAGREQLEMKSGPYDKLLSILETVPKPVYMITFNYDPLIHWALRRHRQPPSYCLDFPAGKDKYPSYPPDNPAYILLHMHGTFNWFQCEVCNELLLEGYSDFYPRKHEKCKNCQTYRSFNSVLIAPEPEKNIPAALQPVWAKASQCLEQATEVSIIGYSFPDIDAQSRQLFTQSLSRNPGCKVNIADPLPMIRHKVGRLLPNKVFTEHTDFQQFLQKYRVSKG